MFPGDITAITKSRANCDMVFEFDDSFTCIRSHFPQHYTTESIDTCRAVALEELKSKLCVHYIAEAGFDADETPIYCAPFDNMAGAIEQLRALYELSDGDIRILMADMHLELDITVHGIGYVAIEECACDNGDEHVE
jgi:hypothetical protein